MRNCPLFKLQLCAFASADSIGFSSCSCQGRRSCRSSGISHHIVAIIVAAIHLSLHISVVSFCRRWVQHLDHYVMASKELWLFDLKIWVLASDAVLAGPPNGRSRCPRDPLGLLEINDDKSGHKNDATVTLPLDHGMKLYGDAFSSAFKIPFIVEQNSEYVSKSFHLSLMVRQSWSGIFHIFILCGKFEVFPSTMMRQIRSESQVDLIANTRLMLACVPPPKSGGLFERF